MMLFMRLNDMWRLAGPAIIIAQIASTDFECTVDFFSGIHCSVTDALYCSLGTREVAIGVLVRLVVLMCRIRGSSFLATLVYIRNKFYCACMLRRSDVLSVSVNHEVVRSSVFTCMYCSLAPLQVHFCE